MKKLFHIIFNLIMVITFLVFVFIGLWPFACWIAFLMGVNLSVIFKEYEMGKDIYRVRLAFWLWELSGCTMAKAWMHSRDAMGAGEMAWRPKELAALYIKHWGIR